MKQTFLLILTILYLTNICSQSKTDLSNIKGIEIFLLETECRNQNSYNEFKLESERNAFFEKYKKTEDIPNEKCLYFIDLENCQIQSTPFLLKSDIKKFDWVSSKIVLADSGIEKLKKQDVPLRGLAFVLKLNGHNIYGGWFWNKVSSFGCDRVWTWKDMVSDELNLIFGVGGFKCGQDPRVNKELILTAIEKGE